MFKERIIFKKSLQTAISPVSGKNLNHQVLVVLPCQGVPKVEIE